MNDSAVAPHTDRRLLRLRLNTPPPSDSSSPAINTEIPAILCRIQPATAMAANDGSPQIGEPSAHPKTFSTPLFEPGVQFNLDLIYRPDPITLLTFQGTERWRARVLLTTARIAEISSLDVNRPLTQPEIDFYLENTSKTLYQARTGAPLGVLFGGIHTAMFLKPNRMVNKYAPTNPGLSLGKRYLEGLKNMYKLDPTAFRVMAAAVLSRMGLWTAGLWIVSNAYALSTGVGRIATDPRVRDIFEARKNQDPNEIRERHRNAQKARAYRERQRRMGESPAAQEESTEGVWHEGASDTPAPATRTSSPRIDDYYPPPAENQSKGGDFFDDDASPIAPDYRDAAPQGSAWDRIRRQNQVQYSTTPQPETSRTRRAPYEGSQPLPEDQDSTSQGSTWDRLRSQGAPQSQPGGSRSQAGVSDWNIDSSRQDKERAQADFDRMLDAERNRGSDSDPATKRTGWWS